MDASNNCNASKQPAFTLIPPLPHLQLLLRPVHMRRGLELNPQQLALQLPQVRLELDLQLPLCFRNQQQIWRGLDRRGMDVGFLEVKDTGVWEQLADTR